MHYTVVYDENNLQADELQQGTHDASYLYARATKAVSVVPAAYYAYLACKRGRCYLNDFWRGTLDEGEEAKRVFEAAQNAWGEGVSVSFHLFDLMADTGVSVASCTLI